MKKEIVKKAVCVIFVVIFGCVSVFAIAPWAKDPANYEKTIETLDSLENKAIILTGTSAALATVAALVPGDATTPIANKLADVAGYMVIVYVAIILEKYLLAMTGLAAFKILIPIALLLIGVSIFLKDTDNVIKLRRIAYRLLALAVLLWVLVPTSAAVTNVINDTYDISYAEETEVKKDLPEAAPDNEAGHKKVESDSGSESQDKGNFFKNLWDDITDKTEAVTGEVKNKVSEGAVKFQESLNEMIEGVAVMIVTTCVIPICVLILFLWIVKIVAGLNFAMPSLKKLPKASNLLHKTGDEKQLTEG